MGMVEIPPPQVLQSSSSSCSSPWGELQPYLGLRQMEFHPLLLKLLSPKDRKTDVLGAFTFKYYTVILICWVPAHMVLPRLKRLQELLIFTES